MFIFFFIFPAKNMDAIIPHPLIKVTEDDVKKARAFYGLEDEMRIKESLDAIEEWCQKQPHLAEAYIYMRKCFSCFVI